MMDHRNTMTSLVSNPTFVYRSFRNFYFNFSFSDNELFVSNVNQYDRQSVVCGALLAFMFWYLLLEHFITLK